MTNAELTVRYNELASLFGLPAIAPWKGKKEVLEARLAALEARLGELEAKRKAKQASKQKEPTKAPRKTSVEKVDNRLRSFLEDALKAGTTPSAAIRLMLETYPQATRILVKHSAKAAGINSHFCIFMPGTSDCASMRVALSFLKPSTTRNL